MKDVLVEEISGKRPGDNNARPTEKNKLDYDHVIISNNADGYLTDWDIVLVPDEYHQWYKENFKTSENFYLATMNRAYAIKYAKERGYKYLVQLDDNISTLNLVYYKNIKEMGFEYSKKFSATSRNGDNSMLNGIIDVLIEMLEQTNAGITGCSNTFVPPTSTIFSEKYSYCIMAMKLDIVPDVFFGDFHDDMDYHIRLWEMGIPTLQNCFFKYEKISRKTGDTTGCRAEYDRTGISKSDHMRKLHSDVFTKINTTKKYVEKQILKHKKLGIIAKDVEAINKKMLAMFQKYATTKKDELKISEINLH